MTVTGTYWDCGTGAVDVMGESWEHHLMGIFLADI